MDCRRWSPRAEWSVADDVTEELGCTIRSCLSLFYPSLLFLSSMSIFLVRTSALLSFFLYATTSPDQSLSWNSPAGSPSRGGDGPVYVWHKPTELAHSFLFCSWVYFCLYGPFNCTSFHKFSRHLSVFWLFFRSYLCLIGPFKLISLHLRLLQPWYNP